MATPTYSQDGKTTFYTMVSNVSNSNANLLFTINSITVDNSGANYNYAPQIDIEGGGGYGARAIATLDTNSGYLYNLTLVNGGANYATAPTVIFQGGGGSGATATSTVTNGVVTSITLTSAGNHYTSAPSVILRPNEPNSNATLAYATVNVAYPLLPNSITVTNQGIGYSNIADIKVKIRGNGSVGTVVIANSGGGYSNTPTAIFSAPQDPHGVTANASLVLAQNSISQVVIGDTGSGYTTAPTILVTAAQNNYPSYTANLIAYLNTGVGAHATANPLPYYTGDPVQGGSYFLRTNPFQTFSWDTSNTFSGDIYIQGSLATNPAETDWFDIKRLNWANTGNSNVTGQETITGKFYWVRARVEDFAAGTINNITVSYPYNS